LRDYTLTINSVKICIPEFIYEEPKPGNKVIVFDVILENIGLKSYLYTSGLFSIQDNKDYLYNSKIFLTCGTPYFPSGTLLPKQKIRGYITFEIPGVNTATSLIFNPESMLSEEQIIFSINI
jgi:hypothetical protein